MVRITLIALCWVIITCAVGTVEARHNGHRRGVTRNLTRYLLNNHDRNAPPDNRIEMFLDVSLVQIVGVNEVSQRMTVQILVSEEWYDHTLSWNPDDFDGLTITWLPVDSIWISDVTVLNTIEFLNLMDSVRTPAEILHTGKVVRSFPATYTFACDINVADFPIDEQSCQLDIASWAYSKDKLIIHFTNRSSLIKYRTNEEWGLRRVTLEERLYEYEGIIHSEASFVIDITRKPLHYIVALIFPCYVICVVGIAGLFSRFSSSGERQERYSLGITSLVSVAVFGTVVAEKIPHTSREVPSIVKYFLHDLVVLSAATIVTGLVMRLTYTGSSPEARMPPAWLYRVLCLRRNHEDVMDYSPMKRHKVVADAWHTVTTRLDAVFFTVFFILITIPSIDIMASCLARLSEPEARELHSRLKDDT